MSTQWTLRPIKPKDDAAVAAIIRTVMPEFGMKDPGSGLHDPEVDAMSASYSRSRHGYFVVERDGQVVGGGGIAPLTGADPSVCELRKMYFLKEARGHGLGEQLVRRCLAFAKEAGYQLCYLETFTDMVRAQKLYQRLGFTRIPKAMGNTGHSSCNHFYTLELSKAPPP